MQQGLLTSALYGAEITPISQATITKLQTEVLKSEGLSGSGIHNNWKWAILDPTTDPEYKIKSAVVARLAREVWHAADKANRSTGPQQDSLTPHELSSLFHMIGQSQQNQMTTGSVLVDCVTEALYHFGIQARGPTIWQTGDDTFDATVTTESNLHKALTRVWEGKLVQKICSQSGCKEHEHIDIRRITRYAARLGSNLRRTYAQVLSRSLYTWQLANKIGAKVSDKRPLGCDSHDTMMHRLYHCKSGHQFPIHELEKGTNTEHIIWPQKSKLEENMLAPKLDDFQYYDITISEQSCSFKTVSPFRFKAGVGIYTDGTCIAARTAAGQAAGAAIQVGEWGPSSSYFTGKAVSWMAPDHFKAEELSSFTSEFLGAMLGIRCNEAAQPSCKENRIDISTDSQALVSGWDKAERTGPSFNRKGDGLFRQALQDWAPPEVVKVHFRKVKAHKSINKDMDEEIKRDILANFAADRAAAWSMASHTFPEHGEKAALEAKYGFRRLKNILQALDQARTETGVPPGRPKALHHGSGPTKPTKMFIGSLGKVKAILPLL